MARRSNKDLRQGRRYAEPRPLSGGHTTAAQKGGRRWIVRMVTGQGSTKTYTCPSCLATIAMGTPHVVAWPDTPEWGMERAVDGRRHWHTGCWNRMR